MGKDLANALHAISAAETRAALAETKLSDLEKKSGSSGVQDMDIEMDRTSGSSSYNELNKQNKNLHSRSADHDTPTNARSENVISYLRRSKEIDEREISLLKGEKLQLQSQLESALKETENAQSSLSSERASSSKSLLFMEEETVSQLEQDLSNSRLKLSEREEKELSKENQALSRQLEEVKLGKRHLFILFGKEMLDIYSSSVGDTSGDQTRKQEKDTSQPVPQPLLRKRQASSSSFGSHEESAAQGETGADVAAPLLKKLKGSDSPKRSAEGQSAAVLENVETLVAHEDFFDVADLPQGSTEETIIVAEKE